MSSLFPKLRLGPLCLTGFGDGGQCPPYIHSGTPVLLQCKASAFPDIRHSFLNIRQVFWRKVFYLFFSRLVHFDSLSIAGCSSIHCTLVIPENRKLKTENYPLMTPNGFSRATFLAIPAPWTTSTTPETSL